eukprot:s5448_g7.t1
MKLCYQLREQTFPFSRQGGAGRPRSQPPLQATSLSAFQTPKKMRKEPKPKNQLRGHQNTIARQILKRPDLGHEELGRTCSESHIGRAGDLIQLAMIIGCNVQVKAEKEEEPEERAEREWLRAGLRTMTRPSARSAPNTKKARDRAVVERKKCEASDLPRNKYCNHGLGENLQRHTNRNEVTDRRLETGGIVWQKQSAWSCIPPAQQVPTKGGGPDSRLCQESSSGCGGFMGT